MAARISFSHTCLILDTSCVISLYASRQMRQILEAITESIKVAAQVNEEALWIYGGPEKDVRSERERIDLAPLVEMGLLEIVTLASEAEMEDYINFAMKLDPGEAATAAIAVNRDWAISVDDKKARTVLQREARHLQQFYTLELVKHWVDIAKPASEIVSAALWNIQMRGVYEPGGVIHSMGGGRGIGRSLLLSGEITLRYGLDRLGLLRMISCRLFQGLPEIF